MPFPLAAIGIAAGSSLLSNVLNRSNQAETVRQQKGLSDYLYKNQESYVAQANNMRQAGLNPAMLTGSPSSSAVAPSVNPVSPASINSGVNNAVDFGLMNSQDYLLRMQAFNAQTGGKLAEQQSKFVNAETFALQYKNDYILPLEKLQAELNLDLTEQDIHKTQAATASYYSSVQKMGEEVELLKKQGKLTEIECDKAQALIMKIGAEIRETLSRVALNDEMAKTEGSKRNLLYQQSLSEESQRNLNKEYAKTQQAQQKYINWNSASQQASFNIQTLEAQARKDLGPKYAMFMTASNDILDMANKGVDVINVIHSMSKRGKSKSMSTKIDAHNSDDGKVN